MADQMLFPDTVEEFMEQYKIVDTEGIYMSKGSELVPIFRMKQWFEHKPERKTGKWIEKEVFYIDDADDANVIDAWQSAKCSVCGKYHTTPYLYSFDNFNYCPKCGSVMTEGE